MRLAEAGVGFAPTATNDFNTMELAPLDPEKQEAAVFVQIEQAFGEIIETIQDSANTFNTNIPSNTSITVSNNNNVNDQTSPKQTTNKKKK